MIHYKRIEKTNREVFDLLTMWDNQKDINHLLIPNFKAEPVVPLTAQESYDRYVKNQTKIIFMIYDDDTPIGNVGVDFGFPLLAGEKEFSGWISICVGEKAYRGVGIGGMAITFIEDFCRENNIKRIELGYFAYNVNAEKLYNKLGYKKIVVNKDVVYYNNEWYDDIRMEKYL